LLKRVVKNAAYKLFPRLATELFSARARAHTQRLAREWGCTALNQKLLTAIGNRVIDGPFKGLALSPMAAAEHLGPYLLGVYESELRPAWEIVFRGTYTHVLDVGSKFGYYAVGLAKQFPNSLVTAFDTDRWARKATLEMVRFNGVTNVAVACHCDPEWLARHLVEGSFIISDCEGYESTLFSFQRIPALASATMVIEIHDQFCPGTSDRIRSMFLPTHDIREFASAPPQEGITVTGLPLLNERERRMAVTEYRDPQDWFLLLPRVGPNRGLRQSLSGSATVGNEPPTRR
jgi:hypothetical protein